MALKFKIPFLNIPKTKKEAFELISDIGEFQKELRGIEDKFKDAVAKLKKDTERRVWTIDELIKRRLIALYGFFIANKKELTKDGTIKEVKLASGELEIFLTLPPTVNIRNERLLVETLKKAGLSRFIKEIVNRKAIQNEPEAVSGIKGISLVQKERFRVTPNVTMESVIEDTKKLRKFLP